MFVDDLILVTKASHKTARNRLMCLNIYQTLTNQKPNLNKSAIYFPSSSYKKLSNYISHILGMNLGSFPFTYLGIPISLKRLLISQLNALTSKVQNSIHSWNHASISTASQVILLNSSIFSLPNYFLSV